MHLRRSLYRAILDEGHSLELSRAAVAAKLQTSGKVADRWARDERDARTAERLNSGAKALLARIPRVAEAQTPNHVRGAEGDAARVYFGGVRQVLARSDFEFAGRIRRPPRDPVNALLGFCYGLMLTEFIGALEALGLDYQMGFFHRPRSGTPSLGLDLAEELRPVTAWFVVSFAAAKSTWSTELCRHAG